MKFKPVSHERLKCMFPVANVPIIHYVIEFLLTNKVTEIFIAVCTHRGQIDTFLKSQNYKGVKINVVQLDGAESFGDALREINQLQTIKNDFILVRGDIITNANIEGALKQHYRAKTEDKDRRLLLTKLFIQIPFSNYIRHPQQEVILILEDTTKEILKYESFESGVRKLKINEDYISLKQSQKKYQIRYDLVDAEISICSKDVLNTFTDNFDYASLYDEFINQIQASEITDDRILSYEIDGYYARIFDPRTYGAVTQDILSRCLHPLVVDSKLLFPKNNYQFHSFNKYYDSEVQIAISTSVSNNCQVGKQTKISTNSSIEKSTIGRRCLIGKNVIIRNSYIWNNVEIQDNCEIENSIICDNVVLKKGSKVGSGSMISFGIVVREGAVIPQGTMASKFTYNSENQQFEEAEPKDLELFEVGVISYLPRDCHLKQSELLGSDSPYNQEEESDFEDADEDMHQENERNAFNQEVRQTIERCIKNSFSINNASMEVKSLKMSYNMEYSDCIEGFIPPIFNLIDQSEDSNDKRARQMRIVKTLTDWKDLINDFVRGEKEDQFTLIRAIEIYCGGNQKFNGDFHIAIQILFKLEILEGTTILQWADDAKKSLESKQPSKDGDPQDKVKHLEKDEDAENDDIFDHVTPEQRAKFLTDMQKTLEGLRQQQEQEQEGEEEYDEEEEEEEAQEEQEAEAKEESEEEDEVGSSQHSKKKFRA